MSNKYITNCSKEQIVVKTFSGFSIGIDIGETVCVTSEIENIDEVKKNCKIRRLLNE